jgi:hypothetical protein
MRHFERPRWTGKNDLCSQAYRYESRRPQRELTAFVNCLSLLRKHDRFGATSLERISIIDAIRAAALCHQTEDRFPERLSGALAVSEHRARMVASLLGAKTVRSTVSSKASLAEEYSSAEMDPRARSASS